MKTRERPAVNNGQANNLAQVDNSSNPNRMNMTKWSIKEKLYLVSCVLVNGDSNWSRICNQLNKWMKFTSSYYGQSAVENFRTNNVDLNLVITCSFVGGKLMCFFLSN